MQICEIAGTAPLVIGYRTARMLTGGWPPSARDRQEYTRMWQEKVEAFAVGGHGKLPSDGHVSARWRS